MKLPKICKWFKRRKTIKLSNMTNDHLRDVLVAVAVELEPILKDEKIASLSVSFEREKNETEMDYGIRVMSIIIGTIKHINSAYMDGIYRLFAALFQCSPEDFGKMTLADTMAQIKCSLSDEVFLSFFTSLNPSAQISSPVISPNVQDSRKA